MSACKPIGLKISMQQLPFDAHLSSSSTHYMSHKWIIAVTTALLTYLRYSSIQHWIRTIIIKHEHVYSSKCNKFHRRIAGHQ
jgi:hypothetical protein